jgi:hypothetical protein
MVGLADVVVRKRELVVDQNHHVLAAIEQVTFLEAEHEGDKRVLAAHEDVDLMMMVNGN